MTEDYYVSKEKLEELKQELEELKTTKRMEVAKRLKRAKELGDLSENSEYNEAREEQTQVERRIFAVEAMIKNAKIIQKPVAGTGEVQIGSTLEISKGKETKKITIVGSSEAKPAEGFISNESPLGKAFLGKKTGESVRVQVPSGEVTYKIINVE